MIFIFIFWLLLDGLELPRVSILGRTKFNFNIFYMIVKGMDNEERGI